MTEYQKLTLIDKSDENLEQYLMSKLKFLNYTRDQGTYDDKEIKKLKSILRLYIKGKTSKDAAERDNYFAQLQAMWKELKPEGIAIILEDCFTNATENSEEFLKSRDRIIEEGDKNGIEYKEATSSYRVPKAFGTKRTHYIQAQEDEAIIKYCALRQLEVLGFDREDLKKLVDRDRVRFRDNTTIDSCLKIATNLEQLLDFCDQERELPYEDRRFTEEELFSNIKEAIDKPKEDIVRTILFNSPRSTLARANFIRWEDSVPSLKRFPISGFELLQYASKDESSFYRYMEDALIYAMDDCHVDGDGRIDLTLTQIFNANIQKNPDFEKKFFYRTVMNNIFGEPTEEDKENIDNYYRIADRELKQRLRDERRKKATTARIRRGDPGDPSDNPVHHKPNNEPRENLYSHEVEDAFVEKAVKKGIEFVRYVSADVGCPAPGEDLLHYSVFKKNGYYVFEPVGQPANATLIFSADQDIDELINKINGERDENNPDANPKRNTLDSMVKDGIMIRLYHSCPEACLNENRLEAIFETLADHPDSSIKKLLQELLIEDIDKEKTSLSHMRILCTRKISKEETQKAAEYIQHIKHMNLEELEQIVKITSNSLRKLKESAKKLKTKPKGKDEKGEEI